MKSVLEAIRKISQSQWHYVIDPEIYEVDIKDTLNPHPLPEDYFPCIAYILSLLQT